MEASGGDFDEGEILVGIEDQGLLRHHQRGTGTGYNPDSREHLRLQFSARITDLAANLQGMRRGVDVGTDTRDEAGETLVGVGSPHRLELLALADAGEVVLVNIEDGAADGRSDPDGRAGGGDGGDVSVAHAEEFELAARGRNHRSGEIAVAADRR